MFIPEEFIIIGTAIHLNRHSTPSCKVSLEEIKNYISLKKFNIEYDNDFNEYKYCKFDKENNSFTINMPNLAINIISILM